VLQQLQPEIRMTASPGATDVDHYPPITIAGQELRAPKDWVKGTHRAMEPVKTLERIRPHLPKAGITRVADITGLDDVGIPVVVAVRPGSGSLAVEAGKGATLHAAATSAAMEAIERFVAEENPCDDVRGTINQVGDRLPCAPEAFSRLSRATLNYDRAMNWTLATDLFTGEETLVPEYLVNLSTTIPSLMAGPWGASSNGLASGNHVPEALCAALYECIERDATSCWGIAHERGAVRPFIEHSTLEGEVINGLIEQVHRADAEVALFWCPTEVGIPTVTAYLWSNKPGVGVYKGYGCHLDPEIAMVRALTEAVQARTIFFAGARDDMLRGQFDAMRRSDILGPESIMENSKPISINDIPDRGTGSFHGDVSVLLESMANAGFTGAYARELELGREFEVAVVRVVTPGLEPYRFPWIAVTDRAKNFVPPAI
jgi:ribosomal protein S12 methylthiotransferase accessory factor